MASTSASVTFFSIDWISRLPFCVIIKEYNSFSFKANMFDIDNVYESAVDFFGAFFFPLLEGEIDFFFILGIDIVLFCDILQKKLFWL